MKHIRNETICINKYVMAFKPKYAKYVEKNVHTKEIHLPRRQVFFFKYYPFFSFSENLKRKEYNK